MRVVYRTPRTFYLILGLVLPWVSTAKTVEARPFRPCAHREDAGATPQVNGDQVSATKGSPGAEQIDLAQGNGRNVADSSSTDEEPGTKAPKRIVAIGPSSAEIICALGACDRLVGVSKYCVYPPELADRPQVGGLFDPDLERIVALRPDLLVMRGRSEALRKLAGDLGVAVYEDQSDSFAGIEICVRDLGRLLHRGREAEAILAAFGERLETIRRQVKGKPAPRVLVTISRRTDGLRDILTAGRGTFLTEMVEAAGGVNVFGELDARYPQVSVESIVARRPQIIVELMPEADLTEEAARDVRRQWQGLPGVPAVMHGRIYLMTDAHALIPSPRCVELVEKISRLLHPDAFP